VRKRQRITGEPVLRADLERCHKAARDHMLSTESDKVAEEDRLLRDVLDETPPAGSAA
jgi:hypothetical protein